MGRGVAGQPEPEVRVGCVGVKLFADFFQGGHPGDCKVTVLQYDPGTVFLSGPDHLDGNGSLSLAQRESAHFGSSESLHGRAGVECMDK